MEVLDNVIFMDILQRCRIVWSERIWDGAIGLEVKRFMSKLDNRAPGQEIPLLATNLNVLRKPVFVPMLPG